MNLFIWNFQLWLIWYLSDERCVSVCVCVCVCSESPLLQKTTESRSDWWRSDMWPCVSVKSNKLLCETPNKIYLKTRLTLPCSVDIVSIPPAGWSACFVNNTPTLSHTHTHTNTHKWLKVLWFFHERISSFGLWQCYLYHLMVLCVCLCVCVCVRQRH